MHMNGAGVQRFCNWVLYSIQMEACTYRNSAQFGKDDQLVVVQLDFYPGYRSTAIPYLFYLIFYLKLIGIRY